MLCVPFSDDLVSQEFDKAPDEGAGLDSGLSHQISSYATSCPTTCIVAAQEIWVVDEPICLFHTLPTQSFSIMHDSIVRGDSNSGVVKSALLSLAEVKPLYMLPTDPLVEDVLVPGFKAADKVDCMVGFFSSEVLSTLAPGLASFIAGSNSSFRLIISPLLRLEDKEAIEEGHKSHEEIADSLLEDLVITEDLLQCHTLKCLTWLLRERRVEIKVALMKDALFHPKVWFFESEGESVVAHGSSNVTYAGIRKNIEQVAIAKSWQDHSQKFITVKLRSKFNQLWENKDDNCIVVVIPDAIRNRLLRTFSSEQPPTEEELQDIYSRAIGLTDSDVPIEHQSLKRPKFTIPSSLQYEKGAFEHQGKAVAAWCKNKYQGVLEMATGSGKTITSAICAHRLYEQNKPLLVVIAAPYLPLIEQWCDELTPFGLNPINLKASGGKEKRARVLQKMMRRLRTGQSSIEAIIVSHNTLCTPEFNAIVKEFDCERLLIADEVHNLGRQLFTDDPPEYFEYRLGLSATPIRQYDELGTESLFKFFGPVVYKYTLKEAIGNCLVEYDYFLHVVDLTESEMNNWSDLTKRIKRSAWRGEEGDTDTYLAKLLRDRRAVLETASGKISKLRELLDKEERENLRHTLVYTSDKKPEQLDNVNELMQDKSIMFHQLTASETAGRERTMKIIKSFQNGDIQVLTAKRVLDEGVNIPQIRTAYILASTTVERQWVQRRGRLLRKCEAVGKTHSVIHDLLALPQGMEKGLDTEARALVSSELGRVFEFASLARNAGRPDGPLDTIRIMVDAAYLQPLE